MPQVWHQGSPVLGGDKDHPIACIMHVITLLFSWWLLEGNQLVAQD